MVNMLLLSRHSWRNFGELALTIILVKIIIAIFDFYFYNSRRLGGRGDERRLKSKERAGTER